jgi:hypothetical protein
MRVAAGVWGFGVGEGVWGSGLGGGGGFSGVGRDLSFYFNVYIYHSIRTPICILGAQLHFQRVFSNMRGKPRHFFPAGIRGKNISPQNLARVRPKRADPLLVCLPTQPEILGIKNGIQLYPLLCSSWHSMDSEPQALEVFAKLTLRRVT